MEVQPQNPPFVSINYTPLNHSLVFPFEESYPHEYTVSFMRYMWTFTPWISGAYLLFVFGGRSYMQQRPRFNLKTALTVWSGLLATFSLCGASRMVPELLNALNGGLYHSICDTGFIVKNQVTNFWGWMFVLSKLPELGDTVFIILRKQPLIFLHWYHHIITLLYCWYSYNHYTSTTLWFMAMNYSVHALMYSYYTLRALGYRIPISIAMGITSLQILQMVAGSFVSLMAFQYLSLGLPCGAEFKPVIYSFGMYVSYFVLFFRFFMMTYFGGKKEKKS